MTWLTAHPWYVGTRFRDAADGGAWSDALASWWQASLGWTDWRAVYYDRHAV